MINGSEKQTDYLVVYSNREIDTPKINLPTRSDKVLIKGFCGTDISYDFENNYIVLLKKQPQCRDICQYDWFFAAKQPSHYRKVTATSGLPLPKVTDSKRKIAGHSNGCKWKLQT